MAKRIAELARLGQQLYEAQARVDMIRARVDAALYYAHEDGVPIAALARESGVSRQTVYASIERYRGQLGT